MSTDGCNIIEHYQKAIKKARNDEIKLLHCIGKLDTLPITIDHLQRTGVGKTVNSLRKYNGEVGDAAKGLVAKWKNMVATGEVAAASSSSPPPPPKPPQNGYGTVSVPVPVEESEYSTKNQNRFDVKESEARLTNNNGKHHREEKRHSDSQRDLHSNHRVKEKDNHSRQIDHHHHHHESRSSSKSNGGREKSHKSSSSGHAEKSNSSSSKSSSSKSSSKRHRDEDSSSSKSHHKRDTLSNEAETLVEPSESLSSKQNGETEADKHHPKAKKPKLVVNDGIDSTMGASFSDALGMCGVGGSSKKSKKLQKLVESKPVVVETPRHSKSTVVEKERKHTPDLIPEALKTSPKIKLDSISLNLPIAPSVKISDNYKPSPINQNVMNCIYPTSMPERPTACNIFNPNLGVTSKTMRTKVYSGVKTGALLSVPSLFDICIRILQKNIDALEYTGGVPYDVLRPVLERTTPQQLLNFEDYNAYLLEDTDELWKQHVGRHFRGKMREEDESWREMFLRCEEEKERRLDILTKNIKISQKQSALPIKKTRLAYVDNVVKPPRNVQRKQELYGTNDKLIASPAARVAALSSGSHNTVVAGDPRLKIGREVNPNNNSFKTKKAPLMAKTLQFMKKTYKR